MSSSASALLIGATLSYALLAALYVLAAWFLARRLTPRYLPALWVLASLCFAVIGLYRAHLLPGSAPSQSGSGQAVFAIGFVALVLSSFGLATLSVRRRFRQQTEPPLSVSLVMRGVGAFFCGAIIVLAVYLVADIRRLLS